MSHDLPPGIVAIPAQEWCWTRSVCALFRLQGATPRASFTWQVAPSTIAQKRNAAVTILLADADYRWLLFLDSDMEPPPDAIHRLWATAEAEDADLVQAAMTKKRPPHEPVGAVVTDRGQPPEDPLRPWSSSEGMRFSFPSGESLARGPAPFEIDAAGTGCLLVRRRVFEALDEPWFCARPDGAGSDYNGTLRMTDAGFRAVLDPGVRVGHVDCYAFGVEDAARAEAAQRQREQIEAKARKRMEADGAARVRGPTP